jgi:hypothetical protein
MYHVEMRQFPHNFCRFNLSEQELQEQVLDAWARQEWLEFGERKWNPHEATLTVLEGPRLELQELSMGRGWRNAQRRGEDVTEWVVASRRAELAAASGEAQAGQGAGRGPGSAPAGSGAEPGGAGRAQALAAELVALLGEDPASLIRAWQLALERHPDRSPSECLALAEEFVRR